MTARLTSRLYQITSTLTLAASLGLGGCAADAGSSEDDFYPHENVGEVEQEGVGTEAEETDSMDLEIVERPVVYIDRGSVPTLAYRAIELPAELSTATTEVLERLIVELDIEVPVDELRDAAANDELVIFPVTAELAADDSEELDLYRCGVELEDGTIADGFCVGEPVETVQLDRKALTDAGFDLENAHTELPAPRYDTPEPVEPPQHGTLGGRIGSGGTGCGRIFC